MICSPAETTTSLCPVPRDTANAERVRSEDRSAYLARVRVDRSRNPEGHPDFDIMPPGARPEYMVLRHVQPLDAGAPGYDLYDPDQRYRSEVDTALRDGGYDMLVLGAPPPTDSGRAELAGVGGELAGEGGGAQPGGGGLVLDPQAAADLGVGGDDVLEEGAEGRAVAAALGRDLAAGAGGLEVGGELEVEVGDRDGAQAEEGAGGQRREGGGADRGAPEGGQELGQAPALEGVDGDPQPAGGRGRGRG